MLGSLIQMGVVWTSSERFITGKKIIANGKSCGGASSQPNEPKTLLIPDFHGHGACDASPTQLKIQVQILQLRASPSQRFEEVGPDDSRRGFLICLITGNKAEVLTAQHLKPNTLCPQLVEIPATPMPPAKPMNPHPPK